MLGPGRSRDRRAKAAQGVAQGFGEDRGGRRVGHPEVLVAGELEADRSSQDEGRGRESAGPTAQVSEMMRYFVSKKDLENPKLTAVPFHGTWHRVTPWLPWMLMGTTPGHCMYTSTMTAFDNVERLPKVILDYARKHKPDILSAPTEDYGPSHSSLEHYARQQKPAPVA